MANALRNIGENILPATSYGDSAGLPVEYLSAQQIREECGKVNRLLPASTHPMFEHEYTPGVWSDDTELSVATTKGLIRAKGFDLETQAEANLEAYDQAERVEWKGEIIPRGWGGTVISSMKRLKAGVSPEKSGAEDDGSGKGSGNGVLMKLAPLVFFHLARGIGDEERYDHYDQLTNMTHNTDIARLTTRIHADFLIHLAEMTPHYRPKNALSAGRALVAIAQRHESDLGMDDETSQLLSYLADRSLDQRFNRGAEVILENTDGRGFFCSQTLAMSCGAFMLGSQSLESVVYRAVNLGGDTDSLASIAANFSNFYKDGNIEFPKDEMLIADRLKLRKLSAGLADMALRVD